MNKEKVLLNKEDIEIDGKKYFISSIPAIQAQRMLVRAFGAFSKGDVAGLSADILEELLGYAGAYNPNGAEVQFLDEEIIGMMVSDPAVLMEIEVRMVEKNFGFLADGRLNRVVERLSRALAPSFPTEKRDT